MSEKSTGGGGGISENSEFVLIKDAEGGAIGGGAEGGAIGGGAEGDTAFGQSENHPDIVFQITF